ncbi:MAG: hypothetical protein IJV90_06830, partial [Candidatus Methanomethylophilaceae archaeon]|nr:hypothetical protein [Candidatus Methanomethylophilaceae archaeon]
SCKPATTAYEVSSKDTDGNMTYTSAERAIADAQPGETISITGNVKFDENATIPEGVTVEVASTASITTEKDLDVAGKLVNEGTITVKGDLDVSGEVDNDNLITLEAPTGGSVGDVTVTGTFVGAVSPNTIVVNAAQFTNDDGENTYTNVAAALAAVAEMDVPVDVTLNGKFSESSDVTLVEGMKLIINGEITLDSIRLVAGSQLLVENDATLTADIVAAVGTEETTGAISDAIVDVSKYKGAATDGSTWTVVYDESKATYTMKMPVYGSGAVVIEAGSVNYASAVMPTFVATGDTLTTLKIASGATIVFEEIVTIEDVSQKAFINEGTVESKKGITFTGALVGGEIVVASGKTLILESKVDTSIVYPAVLAGNVTLKEYKGTVATVTINGLVYIGTAPETLGATGSVVGEIMLQDISGSPDVKGQVIVFEGSTFQDTTENSTLESTAYSVNGIALATAYVAGEVGIVNDYIKKIVSELKDVKAPGTITWYADEKAVTDENIGYYPAVDAKVPYKTVDVIVSVGPGMLVYIDDLDYSTYTDAEGTGSGKDITIGTHTVTVYIEKGYEGTPAITFNGQTITDGKLVLTSDMLGKENKLVVTGATVMQDQPVVIQPSDSEKDGMELTDILLIVLVVLIVIMAIIVALRMMRS